MRGRVIFVVDDQRLIADTLEAILRLEGYEARAFYSGAEAIAAASECAPDILVTDFLMPEMDGLTLALEVTALNSNCAVLVMSGNIMAMDGHPAQQRFPVLEKPLLIPDFLNLLKGISSQDDPMRGSGAQQSSA